MILMVQNKTTARARKGARFTSWRERAKHAATAPTGVHSILDVMVLADLAGRIREGALTVAVTAGLWYGLRTALAFVATYFESEA